MQGRSKHQLAAIVALPAAVAAAVHAAPTVPDAASAIAELVANALDAGARHVRVRLLELGPTDVAFATEDDGIGIPMSSFAALAWAPGCTSKLRHADELAAAPSTLGFKACCARAAG
jgi:DNA mismatch repair protein MutL